ncbi:MAG TPA: glycerophosphodiester phosphodiesterase family protein [Opitutales bacterium]|nr:glycerophosphodiester phosphodiesterase family protein [Opitutales bacterium]
MFKILLNSCLAAAGILSLSLSSSAATESVQLSDRLQKLVEADRPLVIAHRGYSMAAPENTIPAFELALLANADLVELDYYHSSDGVPFSFHDGTLNRTSNAESLWNESRIPTASKTWAELEKLDVGSWFGSQFSGAKIPTLAESLDAIQPGSITLIERKQGDPETLIHLLKEKEILNDVIIQAFDWKFITECNELAPGAVLGALGPPRRADGTAYPVEERFLNADFLDQIEKTGANVVGWNRQVTPEAIEDAHRRGLRVWVYTINDLDLAVRLLDMGVDGIISDNPAMVWKAIATR